MNIIDTRNVKIESIESDIKPLTDNYINKVLFIYPNAEVINNYYMAFIEKHRFELKFFFINSKGKLSNYFRSYSIHGDDVTVTDDDENIHIITSGNIIKTNLSNLYWYSRTDNIILMDIIADNHKVKQYVLTNKCKVKAVDTIDNRNYTQVVSFGNNQYGLVFKKSHSEQYNKDRFTLIDSDLNELNPEIEVTYNFLKEYNLPMQLLDKFTGDIKPNKPIR